MASKKTTKDQPAKAAKKPAKGGTKTAAAKPAAKPKAEKKPRAAAAPAKARHPFARVKERFGTKEDLVKALVEPLAAADEDTDALRGRLLKASNQQLLRLQRVVSTVQEKWGSRDKLIDSIGKAMNKAKDRDYLAKLAALSLPRLLDLATTTARRAKSAS
jgi:hypothetical protein